MEFTLLPQSPSIISLGRLCMLDGFSLHWPAGQTPYLIDPSGQRIDLDVDRFVPYISSVQLDAAVGSTASPLLSSYTVPAVGVDPQPATAADESSGSAPNEPGEGSREDPNPIVPPPAPLEETGEASDADSIES